MRYPALPSGLRKLLASDRLRHVAIAAVIAVVFAMSTLLRPIDITIWSLQSKMFDVQPSGDIVLVEVEQGDEPSMIAEENAQLTRTLTALDEAGAARLFIDIPLQRSRSVEIDAALRDELERLGDRVALTRTYQDETLAEELRGSDPFFERGRTVVSNDLEKDFLGFVWKIGPTLQDEYATPALWTELVGSQKVHPIYPDYGLRLTQVWPSGKAAPFEITSGQYVVITDDSERVKIPGGGSTSAALIHVIAAETAMQSRGYGVGWTITLLCFSMLLALAACIKSESRLGNVGYGVFTTIIIGTFFVAPYVGTRLEYSSPFALMFSFALFRGVSRFKRRHMYTDQRTKLPNFTALVRDFSVRQNSQEVFIVVAKIARMDAVFSMLDANAQVRYVRQLANRLVLGDQSKSIYYDGGKYFAFVLSHHAHDDPTEHLEGLRAIVSQAVTVGTRNFDVSLTIGADTNIGADVANRLNSAIAAADQAREAYRPVFVISDFAADSEKWDYSLQSRLETALSEDRISIKLQPQINLLNGEIVGCESLARWFDQRNGEISPAQFILQCERVGRLDELTKRVFFKTLQAAEELQAKRLLPQISINVSAVQFVDGRIADLIIEQLAHTAIHPKNLTIEVTETARIEDFRVARDVIEQIKQTGALFSLDDFGIASANYDALFQLPFDEVKIDRMFVDASTRSSRARAIVGGIIKMAREAQIVSVAEGIENAESLGLIRELGCDIGQGYFIDKPLTVDEFEKLLLNQKSSGRTRKA
ncbi:MAG: EAL domain-containing protein [Parerythrobacter sp.]